MLLVRAVYVLRPLQLGTTSRSHWNRQLPEIGGLLTAAASEWVHLAAHLTSSKNSTIHGSQIECIVIQARGFGLPAPVGRAARPRPNLLPLATSGPG
jgi:hypothetical protein